MTKDKILAGFGHKIGEIVVSCCKFVAGLVWLCHLFPMSEKPIAELIDDLLAAHKTIGGEPEWQVVTYSEEKLVMPLMVDGRSSEAELIVSAYPTMGHKTFRLLICAPRCVWRVDHNDHERHVNSINRPSDLKEMSFCCPHYHAWPDNRRFSTRATLPEKLLNARILPQLQSFDSVLRWFCGETNIEQPPTGLITLPPRTTLV